MRRLVTLTTAFGHGPPPLPLWPAAASGRVISIPCAPAIATTSAIAGRPRGEPAAARANASIPSPGE